MLTPDDVRTKQFSQVSLRRGYDMDEVDAFLDEVETEMRRLVSLADAAPASGAVDPVASLLGPTASSPPTPATAALATPSPVAPAPAAPAPTSDGDPAAGAARILALAQETADRLVDEARREAEELTTQAREAAAALEAETAERRATLTADLDAERLRLADQIDELRAHEREYRSRLTEFHQQQLDRLRADEVVDTPPVGDHGDTSGGHVDAGDAGDADGGQDAGDHHGVHPQD
jgi:DivIVA domain-containing protein